MKFKNKKYFHYKGKVYDLEIQSEQNDHSYNIENIVVHNSAAGSVVAYAIGITDLCPITHKLMFERFINPNRKVMADIDFDSSTDGRDKVVEYLVETYGRDHVCNVATFGTYSPKSALKDMSRGLRKSSSDEMILSKKINKLPELAEEGVNKWKPKSGELIRYFDDLLEKTTDFDIKNWIENNKDTIKLSDKLQGQMKSIGTHAGGIVVTPEPLYNYMPVMKNDKKLVSAFREADGSAKELGELGILKLDVLGLKTLDILRECVQGILRDTGVDLYEKIYHLPLDDQKMIKAFATGNNYGIFQMERSAMFTSQFKRDGGEVDSFEDIVAINAINRPGPLETFLPKYGYWKAIDQGKIEISAEELVEVDKERYPFEFMRKILSSTWGCVLYQEQVMLLVSEISGMNFGEADNVRRAMAWKKDNPKYYTVAPLFESIEKSMFEKGYTQLDVDYFMKFLRDASGYNFNRCLSGDEKILGKDLTIERLYSEIHVDNPQLGNGYSMNEYNDIIENNIVDIRYEGIKPIYRVTLESGETIDTTLNHKFPTNNGEKQLSSILPGVDQLYLKVNDDTELRNIVSIIYLKDDKVYDVEMAAPYHNFTMDNGIVTSNSHSVAYSYVSWQTLFFKVYYPAYFYAAMLNIEDKEDKIQEIIEDAKKNTIEVLPLSIANSQYLVSVESPTAIRLGYKLIRGMGDAVIDELKTLEMHKCTTIDEVLQKPFKKINKSSLNNLIRLGCFDEFGVDRDMIEQLKALYKEEKIEKWFTRKRSPGEEKTMPECLSTAFDVTVVMSVVAEVITESEPHIKLVSKLAPYLTVDKNEDAEKKRNRIQKQTIDAEMELLGFTISTDDSFNDFARSCKAYGGIHAISDYDENEPRCYFKLSRITELKTKKGKPYWQFTLNDGRKEFKTKVWKLFKEAKEGDYAVGELSSSDFGWTLENYVKIK